MTNEEILTKIDRVTDTLEMVIQLTRTAPASLEILKGNPDSILQEGNKALDAILGASYAMKNELIEVSTHLHELED